MAGPKLAATKRTVEEWTRDLKGKPVEAANEMIVADGTDKSYEAFAALYAQTPQGIQARDWLDRHRRMVAWNKAVIINTAAGYRAFLAKFPDSDLAATARKLEERLRNRPDFAAGPCRHRRRTAKRRADLSLQRAGSAAAAEESRCADQARRSGSAQARRSPAAEAGARARR